MGVAKKSVDSATQAWIEEQKVFFVATAPQQGHVNVSPKGYDSFRVIDKTTIAYLDLTGSGAETIAHIRENGRITFMWCGFEKKPIIVRAYGIGAVFLADTPGYEERKHLFDNPDGVRSIIECDVTRVSSSCGWSIPFYDYAGERNRLNEWAIDKGPEGIRDYQIKKNQSSIDGLPTGISKDVRR